MRKTLFLLLIARCSFAQTDSLRIDTLPQINFKEVDITAAGSVRAQERTPATFINLDKWALQQNNLGQDLPILLDNTPSVVTTSDAGAGIGYTGIRIRGSDATRVNVTLNGVPVNDAESQGVFWVNTPDIVSSVQNIQIQRGVGTSTNGAASFGGQVSLQTNNVSEKPYGEAGISLGSFNTIRANMRGASGYIKDRFFVEASASWIRSDGYVERASSNLRSWFAQTGYRWKTGSIKAMYFGGREKTYQAWYGVPQDSLATNRRFNLAGTDFFQKNPPYNNETDNYGQDYFQLHYNHDLHRHLSLNISAFTTLGRGYYEQYKVGQDIQSYFEDVPSAATDLVRQRWLKNIFYGALFNLRYKKDELEIVTGGLFSRYNGQHFGKVVWADNFSTLDVNRLYYEGNSVKTDANMYARISYRFFRKLTLYADVQYRPVFYNTSGVDNDKTVYDVNETWHFVNPKAGLYFEANNANHVYLSYALGNREPNRDDVLAANVNGTRVKPETMHNIETGYRLRLNNFHLQANGYLMYYQNQLVLTGRINDVGNPVKENVNISYRTGIELSGSWHFTRKSNIATAVVPKNIFSIGFSLAYSLNRIRQFNEVIYTYDETYTRIDSLTQIIAHRNTPISFSPDWIAGIDVTLRPLTGLSVNMMSKLVSRQFLDNTGTLNRSLKPFFYSNLNISYALPLKKTDKEISVRLLLNNVFNQLFESNGYTFSERYAYLDNNQWQTTDVFTYNYYYPQAGFNWLCGLYVKF